MILIICIIISTVSPTGKTQDIFNIYKTTQQALAPVKNVKLA